MSLPSVQVELEHPVPTGGSVVRKVLVAAAGNLLEWYDFAVYGLFANEISENFFPCADEQTALLHTFTIFAGAFLVRPIGGVIFGHIGDRRGREVALLGTILTMAVPTLCIGLLPSYDTIGPAAPVLLALLRLIQGLAAGGELPGALVYAVESAAPTHRATFGALVQATGVGSLLASLVAAVLHAAVGDAAVRRWAWRVPFILGAGIAAMVCCLRRNFTATPAWEAAKRAGEVGEAAAKKSSPLAATLRSEKGTIARLACASTLSMSGYYMLFVWVPTHLRRSGQLGNSAFALNFVAILTWAVSVVGGGMLADRTPVLISLPRMRLGGITLISTSGALLVAILGPLTFGLISADPSCFREEAPAAAAACATAASGANATAQVAMGNGTLDGGSTGGPNPACATDSLALFTPLLLLLVACHGLHAGPLQAWFVLSLKRTASRYSGLGLGYNVSAALLAGTTPLIATAIAGSSLGAVGAGSYLSVAGLIASITLLLSERCAPIDIHGRARMGRAAAGGAAPGSRAAPAGGDGLSLQDACSSQAPTESRAAAPQA